MINYEKIEETSKFILGKIDRKPDLAIILGSGLGSLAEEIENATIIKYEDIPNFPVSTVKGHAGQLICGELEGKYVLAMQGRFHYYEGYPIEDVVLPIRVMVDMGIESLLVTNAAGGVDTDFKPGDLMLITDHINFAGVNPLIGGNNEKVGPRFVDLSEVYNKDYRNIAREAARKLDIDLKEGAYMWFTGPTYETPQEVKMARIVGASAVGMSTVPETIVATHGGMKILGISCITNMAAGVLDQPLNHEEVVEVSLLVKDKFQALVREILKSL